MKQKAFTLIELIAVIAILALIALIVFPAINSLLKSSKDNAYESQKAIIVKAAKEYYLENTNELPNQTENATTSIKISDLLSEGFISEDNAIDPRTNKEMKGEVVVTYKSNQYIYEFSAEETKGTIAQWFYTNSPDKAVLKAQQGIYKGQNVNNYAKFSGKNWRILRVNSDGTIKLVMSDVYTNSVWDTANNSFNTSTVNTTLKAFYNSLSGKSSIVETDFCTGIIGNECSERTKTYAGLLSTADYVDASNSSNCSTDGTNCNTGNYLTALSGYTLNKTSDGKVYYINNTLATTVKTTSLAIRPVVTLKATAKVTGGSGQNSSPYIIS